MTTSLCLCFVSFLVRIWWNPCIRHDTSWKKIKQRCEKASCVFFQPWIGKGEWIVLFLHQIMGFGTEVFGCVSKLSFVWLTEVRGCLTASWPKEVLLANESPGILGWECWVLEDFSTLDKELSGFWTALLLAGSAQHCKISAVPKVVLRREESAYSGQLHQTSCRLCPLYALWRISSQRIQWA